MKVTITSIELKSPFKFFPLSLYSMRILKQLKTTSCAKFKSTGLWTKHYTMSLWNSERDLKEFARSGSHLDAMKRSKHLAKEIRTYTYDSASLPKWKEAKILLLEKGRSIRY